MYCVPPYPYFNLTDLHLFLSITNHPSLDIQQQMEVEEEEEEDAMEVENIEENNEQPSLSQFVIDILANSQSIAQTLSK